MTRSMPSTVSVPQRLAACALVVAGALCLLATSEGLRLRSAAVEAFGNEASTIGITTPTASPDPTIGAATAIANAQANLAKAIEAFTRADADEAARFALTAQDDLAVARAASDSQALGTVIEEVEAGLQALREQGLSREDERRSAPPVFDFFRGFQDWGNPDASPGDGEADAPSAHPLGPARPLANGRHIMASLPESTSSAPRGVETRRA